VSDKSEVSEKMEIITSKAGELTVLETWMGDKYIRICRVRCFCGKIFEPRLFSIRKGRTKSCGCYQVEMVSKSNYKHGHSNIGNKKLHSKTYSTWFNIKNICTNKNDPKYPRNGGRGIKLCEEWLKFENFLHDMGEKPDGFRLKRLDKDRGFELGNCKWFPIKKKDVS